MRKPSFSIIFTVFCMGVGLANFSAPSRAQKPNGSPALGGEIKKDPGEFLNFNYKYGRESDTLYILDKQNRAYEAGDRSPQAMQNSIDTNRSRAQSIANMIKDEELEKAMVKVTARGKQLLHENQDLKNPLGVIAGAASLWYGRSVRLIRSEAFHLFTRVDGRNRSGEFSMESPLVNGRLKFQSGNGVDISMNRKISSISSEAELNYNTNTRSFNTEFRHRLAPNIDLSFGASKAPEATQTDGRASFQYRLDF